MSYENVKLWFAKNEKQNIVTIDEINDENKHNTYSCPVCGSNLKPKATKSKQVTSHFAHVDASKCNSESQIHFWFKHKFLEKGDTFTVVADEVREYICKDMLVEQPYEVENGIYKPDVTIHTECGNTIYFEMAFTNKKKVKDYLDNWLELKNIVVEVDIKQLMLKDEIPTFKALFYEGKCFNTKRNDTYYNTIGKYKEEKLNGKVNEELKERIRKLDWFWNDVFRYKKGEVDIEHMVNLIDSIEGDEMKLLDKILSKQNCSQLSLDYDSYHKSQYKNGIEKFSEEIKLKYDKLIKIEYDKKLIYHSISILSKLRNNNEYNEIGSTSGGWVFNLGNLKSNIDYINECIQWEIDDLTEINKQNKIVKNNNLFEAINLINLKYEDIDKNYKIGLEWNGRYNCGIDSMYHIYLKLKYGSIGVLSIDITEEEIFYTNEVKRMFDFIDEKISEYRVNLHPFNDLEKTIQCLNKIVDEYKLIKTLLPEYYYKHRYSSNDIISFSLKEEGEIELDIWHPFNSHGFSNWKMIRINSEKIKYWLTINDKHVTRDIRYEGIADFENLLNSNIQYLIKDCFKFKCIECKEEFIMQINEIKFYQKKWFAFTKKM